MISSLVSEAMMHGVACMSTSDKQDDFLVKLSETTFKEESDPPKFTRNISRNSISCSADFFESNFHIGYKPEAFKYSIICIIFDNVCINQLFFILHCKNQIILSLKCLEEDLDLDIDCIILAKKYADIRAKLVFETKRASNSNYSKRICCINHYLKETHKQALIISNKQEQDALYLQNMLRFSNWNVNN